MTRARMPGHMVPPVGTLDCTDVLRSMARLETRCLLLRRAGRSWQEVAGELGISEDRARRAAERGRIGKGYGRGRHGGAR